VVEKINFKNRIALYTRKDDPRLSELQRKLASNYTLNIINTFNRDYDPGFSADRDVFTTTNSLVLFDKLIDHFKYRRLGFSLVTWKNNHRDHKMITTTDKYLSEYYDKMMLQVNDDIEYKMVRSDRYKEAAKFYPVIKYSKSKNDIVSIKMNIVFDYYIDNAEELAKILTTKQLSAYTLSNIHDIGRFSDTLRGAVDGFLAYHRIRVNDLGTRPNGINSANTYGLDANYYNIENRYNSSYLSVKRFIAEIDKPDFESEDSLGQTKLLYSDLVFIQYFKVRRVIYIGGSPGQHINYICRKWGIEFINIDPRPMIIDGDNIGKIIHIQGVWPEVNIDHYMNDGIKTGLIWDVRTEGGPDGLRVFNDNLLLVRMTYEYARFIPMSLKFRFEWKNTSYHRIRIKMDDYHGIPEYMHSLFEFCEEKFQYHVRNYKEIFSIPFIGSLDYITIYQFMDIWPQAYSSTKSYESRIICDPAAGNYTIKQSEYDMWMRYVMFARQKIKDERDLLTSVLVNVCDYTVFTPKDNLIGLFTISNNSLPDDEIDRILQRTLVMTLLPESAALIYRGIFIDNDRVLSKDGHLDYLYDVNVILKRNDSHNAYSIRDAIAILSMNQYGFVMPYALKYIASWLTTRSAMSWVVLIRKDIVKLSGHESNLQTWTNGQTNYTKILTPILRTEFNLDTQSLHIFRRYAIKKRYPEAKLIVDDRINAIININGKERYLAIAGHIVNMALASSVFFVDIRRYVNTLTENIKDANSGNFTRWKLMVKGHLQNETSKHGLWHNKLEYIIAMDVYLLMAERLKVKNYNGIYDLFMYYLKDMPHSDEESITVINRKSEGRKFIQSDASLEDMEKQMNKMFEDPKVKVNLRC
jgi:hypothetical protein